MTREADTKIGEAASSASSGSRHRWDRRDNYNATCRRCGIRAQKRPHPYERRWFTEWQMPDGTFRNNYDRQPTPPCNPARDDGQARQ